MWQFPKKEPPIYIECLIMSFRIRVRSPRVMMVQNMPAASTTVIEKIFYLLQLNDLIVFHLVVG